MLQLPFEAPVGQKSMPILLSGSCIPCALKGVALLQNMVIFFFSGHTGVAPLCLLLLKVCPRVLDFHTLAALAHAAIVVFGLTFLEKGALPGITG